MELFDNDLETAIDTVGRDKVFRRAMHYGWLPGAPLPKWVWWGIVHQIKGKDSYYDPMPGDVPRQDSRSGVSAHGEPSDTPTGDTRG